MFENNTGLNDQAILLTNNITYLDLKYGNNIKISGRNTAVIFKCANFEENTVEVTVDWTINSIDELYSLLEDAKPRRNAASHGASPINIEECKSDRILVLSDVEAVRKGVLGIIMLFLSLKIVPLVKMKSAIIVQIWIIAKRKEKRKLQRNIF